MGHGVSIKSFYVWSRTMSSAQVNNSGAVVNNVQDANHMEQEYGRSDTDYETRVRLNVDYVRHWSYRRDIVLLVMTPRVFFVRSGAY